MVAPTIKHHTLSTELGGGLFGATQLDEAHDITQSAAGLLGANAAGDTQIITLGTGLEFDGNVVNAEFGGAASMLVHRPSLKASSFLSITFSVVTLNTNTLYGIPFVTPRTRTFNRIGLEVTTLGAGNARLGIYNDNGNAGPGTLLLDAGTVDTGSTGEKEVTISQEISSGSLHWLVLVADGTPVLRAFNASAFPLFGVSGATTIPSRITRSFTYAALPSDESAQTYTDSAQAAPFLWLRVA